MPATLLLAFVGGMILNLMPCVFPVLGIKILGFVNQSGHDRKKVTLHGLVFALGVLLSFWALAGVLLALRAGGSQLGWGFQLQSPAFVFGMAVFLLIFALNLSGLFEVGLSATGGRRQPADEGGLRRLVLHRRPRHARRHAVQRAVFSRPRSAPRFRFRRCPRSWFSPPSRSGSRCRICCSRFSRRPSSFCPGPARGWKRSNSSWPSPLYATVGWLLWVLAGQTKDDDNALLLIAFGFVLVAMAAWAYGRFAQFQGKPGKQLFGRVFAAALLVGGLWTGWPRTAEAAPAGSYQVTWEQWSPEAITAAQAAGKFVYVDFTARWCATCQTNKAAVFHSAAVLAEFGKKKCRAPPGGLDQPRSEDHRRARALEPFRRAVQPHLCPGPGRPRDSARAADTRQGARRARPSRGKSTQVTGRGKYRQLCPFFPGRVARTMQQFVDRAEQHVCRKGLG